MIRHRLGIHKVCYNKTRNSLPNGGKITKQAKAKSNVLDSADWLRRQLHWIVLNLVGWLKPRIGTERIVTPEMYTKST